MSQVAWSAFYPDVMINVENCPEFTVDRFLRRAAIEICSQSKRLKFAMDPISTIAGHPTYDLDPDSGTDTVSILDCTLDDKPLDPIRRDEIARFRDWTTEQRKPTKYLMDVDDETVRFWRIPDAIYQVQITLSLKPSQTAAGIEAWFADRYRDAIVSGALAGLHAIPKQVWSDAGLALFHDGRFQAGIRKACADADKDGTRAPLHTKKYGSA